MNLPYRGEQMPTDNGAVRQADQVLVHTLTLLDDVYGWVQVLKVLRDEIATRYVGGIRFADYLIKAEEYKARWDESENILGKGN